MPLSHTTWALTSSFQIWWANVNEFERRMMEHWFSFLWIDFKYQVGTWTWDTTLEKCPQVQVRAWKLIQQTQEPTLSRSATIYLGHKVAILSLSKLVCKQRHIFSLPCFCSSSDYDDFIAWELFGRGFWRRGCLHMFGDTFARNV